MPDPIKPKPKYIDAPVTKRIYSNDPVGTKGINVLDSQYDRYINPSNVDAIGISRGTMQPWYDQLANNTAKLIPAIGLGIIENAGYIAELGDSNQDYTNALTEWATKKRQGLDEMAPVYRQNPNETFDLSDSGWWAQHGMGLVESIGEFFVTGAGVGGATSAVAKGIANAVKAGKMVQGGLQAAAQLGTASTLAYTEGAMSGAQIYKEVYESELRLGKTPEEATGKAAQAASETVRLNTILNTGLNITALSPMFKTMNSMRTATKLGLNRKAGEKLADWSARLGQLETQGIIQPNFKKALLMEAGQEALEEDVNLFAESEGRITGGLAKSSSSDPFQRFFNTIFTEEGALNAILGAVGGVGQTSAINYLPYRTDANGKKISNSALAALQENEAAKNLITDLKEDIGYITTKQKELNTALEKGDKNGVLKAKEDLFNVAMLRAIRNGTASEFAEEIKSIGMVDNFQVGEDGKTQAMRLGYADSIEDNEYKQTAARKANDLIELADDYESVAGMFEDKFVADQVFRQRLNIYSMQEVVDKLDKENNDNTTKSTKLITDPLISPVVLESARVSAINDLILSLENQKERSEIEDRMLGNLRNTNMINSKLMVDALQLDPSLKAKLTENAGVVKRLTTTLVPLIGFQEELRQLKGEYNKTLDNPNETKKALKEVKEAVVKELTKKDTEKKIEDSKQQEKKDKEDAKLAKTTKKTSYREPIGNFVIVSNPKGGFNIIDEEANVVVDTQPTVELARATAQDLNKKAKAGTIKAKEEVINTPIIIDIKTPQTDNTPQIKTKEDKDKQEELEKEAIQENSINENTIGKANKIAYRAKEGDELQVNPEYLVLHSSKFKKGTKIVLKVAKETPFFKEGMSNGKVPIGIYYKKKLVGYVHVLGDNDKNVELARIRDYVVANGEVKTTIIDKDLGLLHKPHDKKIRIKVDQALPQVKAFVIAKDDGKIYTGVGKTYSSNKLVNKSFQSGITYAIVSTPNGKEFAIALDTLRLSEEVVKSIMIATRIFLNPELTDSENALLNEIFEKFDIDVRTPQGYEKYFKMFLFDYNLSDEKDVEQKILDKKDKRWINFANKNGVRFLKSGGQLYEVGKNTPEKIQEGLLTQLQGHLAKMYYNVDLELLQNNSKINIPIFKVDDKQNLTYSEYSKKTYADHIASTTETDVVQFEVGDNEYSAFVSPKIYFSTSFLSTSEEENYGKKPKKSEEKAILSADPKKEAVPSKIQLMRDAINAIPDIEHQEDIRTDATVKMANALAILYSNPQRWTKYTDGLYSALSDISYTGDEVRRQLNFPKEVKAYLNRVLDMFIKNGIVKEDIETSPKKKFKSMTKRLPSNKTDEGQVTGDNVDERVTLCE